MLGILILFLIGIWLIRRLFFRPFGMWRGGMFGPRMWGGWGRGPMAGPPRDRFMGGPMEHRGGGFGGPGMRGHGPGGPRR